MLILDHAVRPLNIRLSREAQRECIKVEIFKYQPYFSERSVAGQMSGQPH